MSQRLYDTTKWLWCFLVIYSGPVLSPVRCVTVRSPPSNPSTIEAQAKFFQYRHFPSAEDYDQGHRLGSDRHFTERHEHARPATGLFSAKVRWGDKKGGYGEHYWDLNHAGYAGDHGNDGYDDDGRYHERNSGDAYDQPSEQAPNYETANYDSEKETEQEDTGREKRAPKRIRIERAQEKEESNEEDKRQTRRRPARKQKEQKEDVNDDNEEEENTKQEVYSKPSKQRRPQKQHQYDTDTHKSTKEKNHVVLVVDEKEKEEKPAQYVSRQPEAKVFVPYEGGAGVRQHYQAEASASASVPRLFLEPATGHVVDRATGQAYVLQPIIRNPSYS
ncbi:uncharacterized protein [Epargyreus clarus]|uniref:uncharacterized protein isoform X2 n=1 Tax=Epargyreus clarus TaxID=520877 RepID=UPI003C2AD6E9